MSALTTAEILQRIRAEREKQIAKGRTAEHDRKNSPDRELAISAGAILFGDAREFPWNWETWNRWMGYSYTRQLEIAAALIVAEIERVGEIRKTVQG
jgi:hypothetical protein